MGTARLIALACLCVTLGSSGVGGAQPDGTLQPGDVLDQSNWQKAEGLLPPEILAHYKNGEYANPVVAWPDGLQRWSEDFVKGTEANRGKLTLDEHGTIIDKATGRAPRYLIGFPFPEVDGQDSQAATKILWNYFYQWWHNGNTRATSAVDWVGPARLERRTVQDVRFLYYDAQPRSFSPQDNPHNLLHQFLSRTVEPSDLHGTAALAWRFRDGEKRDLMWAYVPALRRVRQVSPSNRSDGFLGSDLSQDDGPFFDGKPQDFTWRLAGETEMLRLTDPYSLRRDVAFEPTPEGGWRVLTKNVSRSGHEVSGWKGVAWAPVSLALAKRPMWIIEATPKDRYYLYGRIQLYIEKDTFEGAWNRKFDWRGELVNVFTNGRGINNSPDGQTYFDASPAAVIFAENVRMRRATVAGPPPGANTPFVTYRVKFSPSLFDYQELMRVGK
jgi:hypothetical protein